MQNIFFISLLLLTFTFPALSEKLPETGSIEGGKADFIYESNCKTATSLDNESEKKYTLYVPGKTMITFYGDSRLDFADNYGKDMMYYLNKASDVNDTAKRNPGWYLQNFGHAGWGTVDIVKHFKECLSSPAYFTGKSFVVNVGGNNWVYSAIFIKANPWTGFLVNVYTRNDVNDILIRLGELASIDENTKKKRVLLLGNYPAFAGGFLPREKLDPDALTAFFNSVSEIFYPPSDKPSYYRMIQDILGLSAIITGGMLSTERGYEDIANAHNANFLRMWHVMQEPTNGGFTSRLEYSIGDILHPNEKGFTAWAGPVGARRQILFSQRIFNQLNNFV